MNIDPQQLPQMHIACHRLTHAIEIKHILRNFTKGVYELYTLQNWQKTTLKYGYTALEPQGERVYRQIWRCPGWPTQPAADAAGGDFDWTVSQFPDLDKDDVYVRIWDMTHLQPLNPYYPQYEPYWLEGQMIRNYIDRHGRAPIGNKLENNRLERGLMPLKIKGTVDFDRWFEESPQGS